MEQLLMQPFEQLAASGEERVVRKGHVPGLLRLWAAEPLLGRFVGECGSGLPSIDGFTLGWRFEGEIFEQAQLLGALPKERAEFDAKIGAGLLQAAFPALHRDQCDL